MYLFIKWCAFLTLLTFSIMRLFGWFLFKINSLISSMKFGLTKISASASKRSSIMNMNLFQSWSSSILLKIGHRSICKLAQKSKCMRIFCSYWTIFKAFSSLPASWEKKLHYPYAILAAIIKHEDTDLAQNYIDFGVLFSRFWPNAHKHRKWQWNKLQIRN